MFGVSQALAPDAINISLPLLMIYEFKGSPFRRFAASGRERPLKESTMEVWRIINHTLLIVPCARGLLIVVSNV